jgi:hypothetical protein
MAAAFQATANANIFIRTGDRASVPRGEPTWSSKELETWLATPGNTPDPFVPPVPPVLPATIAQPFLDKLAPLVGMTPAQVAAAISAAARM